MPQNEYIFQCELAGRFYAILRGKKNCLHFWHVNSKLVHYKASMLGQDLWNGLKILKYKI